MRRNAKGCLHWMMNTVEDKSLSGKKDMPWIKCLNIEQTRNLLFSTVTIVLLSNSYLKEHGLIRELQQINRIDR